MSCSSESEEDSNRVGRAIVVDKLTHLWQRWRQSAVPKLIYKGESAGLAPGVFVCTHAVAELPNEPTPGSGGDSTSLGDVGICPPPSPL